MLQPQSSPPIRGICLCIRGDGYRQSLYNVTYLIQKESLEISYQYRPLNVAVRSAKNPCFLRVPRDANSYLMNA